jgi:drug/metabolite transporter (DMT)-like permease
MPPHATQSHRRPLLKADSARERAVGIALLSLATLCFSVLDTTAKWLVQDLPVVQVVWLRFATHVLLMVLLLAPRHGRRLVRMHSPRLQIARGAMLASITGTELLGPALPAIGRNKLDPVFSAHPDRAPVGLVVG